MDNVEILFLLISIFSLGLCIIGYAMIREMNENIKILDQEIQKKADIQEMKDELNEPEPFIDGVDSRRDKPKYLPLEFEKPITGEEIFQKHLQDFYNKEFKNETMVDFNELEKTELDSIKNSVGFAMYRLNQSLDEFSKILKEEIKRLNSKNL